MSEQQQSINSLHLKFSEDSLNSHEIFFKEHTVRRTDPDKPEGRTLYIGNIPPYATEESLKNSFSEAGKIEKVLFQNYKEPENGFRIAYMVFAKRKDMLKALKLEELKPLSSTPAMLKVGLEKWIQEYNSFIINPVELQSQVNEFIKEHDKAEQETKSKEENVADDEGWTVVSKKNRNPVLSRKENVRNKIIERNKDKSKKKELKNFYTFQIKEDKMKKLVALRKNFQESKEKVMAMKKLRVFKPF